MISPIRDLRAYLTCIGAQRPSSVFFGFMVVEALFWIMLILNLALLSLEIVQIDEDHHVFLFILIGQILFVMLIAIGFSKFFTLAWCHI